MPPETAATSVSQAAAILSFLQDHLGYLLIGLLILTLVLCFLIVRQQRRSKRAQPDKAGAKSDQKSSRSRFGDRLFGLLSGLGLRSPAGIELSLLQSFHAATTKLRAYLGRRNCLYDLPWHLMIGPEGAGRSAALRATALHLPLGEPRSEPSLANPSCSWWVFEHGLVIEPAAEIVGLPELGRDAGRQWRQFGRLLQWYRPKRPLDGLIVVLPADLFVGADAKSTIELVDTGKLINRRLGELQRRLGISLPVYVVITKCDVIPGFRAFWQAVPADKRSQMFGWSTPYNADVTFKEAWLDDALADVRSRLNHLRLEQAALPTGAGGDEAFLFPSAFDQLGGPLKQCLRHLLYAQAAEDVLPFRGLYFSGDAQTHGQDGQDTVLDNLGEDGEQAKVERKPSMLTDLLAEKIFRERGLARPISSSLTVRNRQVRAAQAALVVFAVFAGLGLTASTVALRGAVAGLEPSLRDIRETVIALREREARAREAEAEELGDLSFFDERDTSRLLDAMGRFETEAFGSVLMPTSLTSDVNDELAAFLSYGFDTVLMRAMYNQLRVRTERALAIAGDGRGRPASSNPVVYADEVDRLQSFVAEMQTIDELASLYNDLATSRNLEHLNILVTQLFGTELPKTVSEVSHLVRAALAKVQYEEFEVVAFESRATTRARQLTWDVHDALFKAGALEQDLLRLARDLSKFAAPETDIDITGGQLRDLREGTDRLSELLQQPSFSWAGGGEFDLGEPYRDSVEMIANTRFFPSDLAAEIRTAGQSDFDRFRARLGAYSAPMIGPLLMQRDGHTEMQPSDELVRLAALIDKLADQPFMAVPPARRLVTTLGSHQWLSWDTDELDRALKLYATFDYYAAESLGEFPEAVRPNLYDLSRARLATAMTSLIAQAQLIESRPARSWAEPISGSDLERRVEDFAAAAPRLDRLIRVLHQLDIRDTASSVTGIAVEQAASLLFEVDGLLEREPAYEPRNSLDRWNGGSTIAVAAYSFADDLQARSYLNYQRERLAYMTETLARPLLDFLDRHDEGLSDQTKVTGGRWRAIADELRKYDKRHADSSVAALERFIRFDLGKISPENCVAVSPVGGPFGSASINYFVDRMRNIETIAYRRCADLVLGDLVDTYNSIAADFNDRLASRYPFGQGSPNGEADPSQLAAFLGLHGTTLERLYGQLEQFGGDPLVLEPQYGFIQSLLEIRRFFQGDGTVEQASTGPGQPFERSLDARFRILRDREVLANHILDWRLEVGRDGVIDSQSEGPVPWQVGDPINLALRWAANSPRRPTANSGYDNDHLVIDGMTARFSYGGDWALLRLLDDQRVEELEVAADLPFVLGFGIETRSAGVEPEIAPDATPEEHILGRGYWRLIVSAGNDDGSIVGVLPQFPSLAPAITTTTATR